MMTCREMTDFIMDYLNGELSPQQEELFALHMEACPPCRAYLATYQKTLELDRDAFTTPDGPVPEEVPEPLIDAILAARRIAR